MYNQLNRCVANVSCSFELAPRLERVFVMSRLSKGLFALHVPSHEHWYYHATATFAPLE